MKNLIIFCFLLFPLIGDCQVRAVNARKLSINFDKTIHLIFPANIRYFDKGSEDVLVSIAENAPYVLKIKANNENFTEETNISAITVDGAFFPFAIGYSSEVRETSVFVGKDTVITPIPLPMCINKNIHLIFPKEVKYSDAGNEQTVSAERTEALNIIRYKAMAENTLQTNLSVITADDRYYSFILNYDPKPVSLNYTFGTNSAILGTDNEKNLSQTAQKLASEKRDIFHIGLSKNKMEFYCSNIFIKDNVLFFCFGLKNESNINFNIDFIKCFIKDIKRLKNTTVQETEMEPLIRYNFKDVIASKSENSFILAFNKFTIPDKKKFEIEIFDKDGGRHLHFRIENGSIISAKKL